MSVGFVECIEALGRIPFGRWGTKMYRSSRKSTICLGDGAPECTGAHEKRTLYLGDGIPEHERSITNRINILSLSAGYRCEYRFDSDKSTSGEFQSPNFPGPYPDNVYCHYYLTGSKDERIRVSFDVFQLEDRQEAG